ncbi:MAG: hypothetical protein K9G33_02535 [Sneathiella sp.]|nr:hypothetical protein [Sneathiella sp.]
MKHRRWLLLLVIYALLLLGGWAAGKWLPELLDISPEAFKGPAARTMILFIAGIFILASATPFVPGAEIGLGLIMLLGSEVLFLVYISMVIALTLSYLVGWLVPISVISGAFKFFGLERAANLTLQLGPLSAAERLEFLTERAPSRILPFLLRHRYLALLVALNLPGNSIIGGGGGIALLAGISGIYRFPAFLLTILIAVAPVPLVFLWTHSTF